jgi:hypothetical protein
LTKYRKYRIIGNRDNSLHGKELRGNSIWYIELQRTQKKDLGSPVQIRVARSAYSRPINLYQIKLIQKCMPKAINMGPGRGQKHRARTALLPLPPNVTIF